MTSQAVFTEFQNRRSCPVSGGRRSTPAGEQVFLNPVSVAVEECSQKGCLALSLLELLGFNLTFVFLGSLLVLIEVRWCGCDLSAYEVGDPASPYSISISECQRTELGSGYRFLQKVASCSLRDVSESKGHSFEIAEGKSTTGGWFSTSGDHLENFKNDWHLGTSSHECDHNLQQWGACMDR